MKTRTSLSFRLISLFAVLVSIAFQSSAEDDSAGNDSSDSSNATPPAENHPVNDQRFHKRLLEIAAEYKKYGIVDSDARLAMLDCRAPSVHAGLPRVSESDDANTHGQKVYYLFAKDKKAYLAAKEDSEQKNQVIVKQAFEAVPVTDESVTSRYGAIVEREFERDGKNVEALQFSAKHGKQRFVVGDLHGLFVMFRTTPSTPGTDDGWVYGTVSEGGSRVTSAGRVASCVECHQDAPHGRLFGLKEIEIP